MRIHNLYEDEAGESHWRDLQVDWTEQTLGGRTSRPVPVRAIQYFEVPHTDGRDWHVVPRRQYVVHLNGGSLITASDGESRIIQAGEVMLLEDVAGRGHQSRAID